MGIKDISQMLAQSLGADVGLESSEGTHEKLAREALRHKMIAKEEENSEEPADKSQIGSDEIADIISAFLK